MVYIYIYINIVCIHIVSYIHHIQIHFSFFWCLLLEKPLCVSMSAPRERVATLRPRSRTRPWGRHPQMVGSASGKHRQNYEELWAITYHHHFTCIYIYIYIYIYTHTHIYIYIHIHISLYLSKATNSISNWAMVSIAM